MPIVLWFLSSVALGVVSFSYGSIQTYRQEQSKKLANIERLNTQVAVRLEFALANLVQAFPVDMSFEQKRERLMFVLNSFLNGTEATNLYPEYDRRSIVALAFELGRLLPPKEAEQIRELQHRFAALLILQTRIGLGVNADEFTQVEAEARRLFKEINRL
ncbi:hypothetical protein HFO42_18005 [Rhizobium leguminosarum]|uniref:Uncharacterized protein n=2 Tax=Rhizobium TaxID=379 RepID=A0A6N9ZJL2_9HYPH|nr:MULTISPECIES: hypothetical protein [Rhizobium]MBY5535580.1 hypothetical protein [Rhizobium leguminosarum]MBY5596684.1 hypothetical protein [Rhizobium leguminosarum]MBY5616076.1 hypothetical protein [Rhizobium leguminosarum]MBY5629979.1 hypothetical protein [Rhizobium leguminosarum]MBY5731109.1 hypothetical protein [Rhizobium leguminosarum]